MNSSNKKTTAYVAYILVSISWYLAVIGAIGIMVIFIFRSAGFVSDDYFVFSSLTLDTEVVQFKDGVYTENLELDTATAKVSMANFFDENPGHRAVVTSVLFVLMCACLYGFYQLKALLKSTVDNDVFNKKNIRRLRIIAFLMMLVDPIRWGIDIYFKSNFQAVAAPTSIHLDLGSLELSYFMIGLLLFVLSTVFEKGYEMYQELKLTV